MGQSGDTVINSSQPSTGQAGVRSSMTSDTADSAVPSTALDYLAGNVNKKEVVGEKIDDQLATVVTDLLQRGMNMEIREKMMEEIHKPENCKRQKRLKQKLQADRIFCHPCLKALVYWQIVRMELI